MRMVGTDGFSAAPAQEQDLGMPPADFEIFARTARAHMWNPEFRKALEDRGVSLTAARFYSELPTMSELEGGFEHTEEYPYLLPFLDRDRMVQTLQRLSAWNSEFNPPQAAEAKFSWGNPAFSHTDAMAYYCMVRELRPKRILEIGSGYSTLVAAEAAQRNGDTDITIIEPFPRQFLREMPLTLHERPVQDFDADFFNDTLADGDLLFIDSTHTVKASSDCCHLYLRILPRIRRKLTVHVHDIYLPVSVNIHEAFRHQVYWTEQHLLAAYLLDNPKVRFLMSSTYARLVANAEARVFMQDKAAVGGGSFWFELDGRLSVPAR